MKIDLAITSDVVCVWCYIGLHRLERALAQRPDVEATLTFHPFELNPDLAPEGMDRQAFVAKKFGAAQWAEIQARLVATAKAENLPLDYAKITWRPNTRKAHALMALASETGRGQDLHRAITAAYFGEGRDIGSEDVLISLAASVGLDKADARTNVRSLAVSRHVAERGDQARAMGINGVPFFVINNKYAISGAQSTEDWLQVFDELGRRTDGAAAS
jgi:predicted DsbA family dithiol-disulfide isomerase